MLLVDSLMCFVPTIGFVDTCARPMGRVVNFSTYALKHKRAHGNVRGSKTACAKRKHRAPLTLSYNNAN